MVFHFNGHTFEKQYKESLSNYRDWEQLEHADDWLLFDDNIGPRLAIDESSLSNGELYTFVTNRDAHTKERSLVAVVAGTKSEDVIAVLLRIDEDKRDAVKEVTGSSRKHGAWIFGKVLNLRYENRRRNMDVPSRRNGRTVRDGSVRANRSSL